jgi:tripartite-type tricarboxylate transporter receptor subunit TctC
MVERLRTLGIEPLTNSPEEFATYIRSEVAKWSQIVKASGSELE